MSQMLFPWLYDSSPCFWGSEEFRSRVVSLYFFCSRSFSLIRIESALWHAMGSVVSFGRVHLVSD